MIKEKYLKQNNQKGVAIIWTVITIAILYSITSVMANLTIQEIRMSSRIDGSLRAYAAAESGIEHAEFLIRNGQTCTNPPRIDREIDGPDLAYFVDIKCENDKFTVISTGKSANISRSIERVFDKTTGKQPIIRIYDGDPGLSAIPDSSTKYGHAITFLDKEPDVVPNFPTGISLDGYDGSYEQIFTFRLTNQNFKFRIGLVEDKDKFIAFENKGFNTVSITDGSASDDYKEGEYSFKTNIYYMVRMNYSKRGAITVKIIEGDSEKVNIGNACVVLFSKITDKNYKLNQVLFEDVVNVGAWSFDSANSEIDRGGISVKLMGLQLN